MEAVLVFLLFAGRDTRGASLWPLRASPPSRPCLLQEPGERCRNPRRGELRPRAFPESLRQAFREHRGPIHVLSSRRVRIDYLGANGWRSPSHSPDYSGNTSSETAYDNISIIFAQRSPNLSPDCSGNTSSETAYENISIIFAPFDGVPRTARAIVRGTSPWKLHAIRRAELSFVRMSRR